MFVIGPIPTRTFAAQSVADTLKCPASIGGVPKLGGDSLNKTNGGNLIYFVCSYYQFRPEVGGDIHMSVRVDWAIAPGTGFTCKFIRDGIEAGGLSGRVTIPSATKTASGDYGISSPNNKHRTYKEVSAKVTPELKKATEQLFAKVEPEAVDCETLEGACTPQGVVTGIRAGRLGGRPVEGAKVELRYGKRNQIVATDAAGRYRFTPIGGGPSPGFDPEKDQVRVTVLLTEWGKAQRYVVLENDTPAALSSDFFKIDKNEKCERNFDASGIPLEYTSSSPGRERWPDVVEIFYRMRQAWRLAELLKANVRYGLPLKIRTFCTSEDYGCRGERGAFARVSQTKQPPVTEPFIAMPIAKSVLSSGSWPDNREYHEFGHYFQAATFGAVPNVDGSTNHGGYYVNSDSADSWAEAFGEFFSMMVSKHVDIRPFPEQYRVDHAYRNFENDYRPWTLGGKAEELALAGLLLDLEDGPEDYGSKRQPPELKVECCERAEGRGDIAFGRVTHVAQAAGPLRPVNYAEATTLWVTMPDGSNRIAPTVPADIEPGESALFGVPLPAGADPNAIKAVPREARPGDIATDDDPMNLTLQEVWGTIIGWKSADARGNGHVFNAADLHRAFKASFAGRDADKEGTDDIDQVFIAHGFFADTDGDHAYEKPEVVGPTSHPADGEPAKQVTRYNTPSFEEESAVVDTDGVATSIVVQVAYAKPNEARSYGYIVRPDADGRVRLALPAPQPPSTVSLIAMADAHEPALAGTIAPDTFWTEAEKNPGRSFLSFSAPMTPLASSRSAGGSSLPIGVIAGAAGAALLGITAFAIGRRRRAASPVAAPAAPLGCPACGQPASGTAFCIHCGTRIT